MTRFMTDWIWTPEWSPEDDTDARIVCFRKSFSIEGKVPSSKIIRITAASRYKLYINGQFVQEGPQKPVNTKEWFVDPAEIAPFLRQGDNTAAVEVLRYPAPSYSSSYPTSNDSLLHIGIAHLYVEDRDQPSLLSGKTGWKCRIRRDIRIVGETERPAPIHAQEEVLACDAFAGWKTSGYDDSGWKDAAAKLFFDLPLADAPGNLVTRTIPHMKTKTCRFKKIAAIREGEEEYQKAFHALIREDRPVHIPEHTTVIAEISAGEEMCGYLLYAFAKGAGAKITTLCSECYAYPEPPKPTITGTMMPSKPRKKDRTDAVNGQLFGHTSWYTANGYGTEENPECYEPFWFRTFRYVQLKIETENEPLDILKFGYRSTGYPLEDKLSFEVSDPSMKDIYDISLRTLARCMHDTYMDCPFYEQLQYAMDGRSEILYTYAVSGDDRLARQAMEAFRCSQRPDGLVNADAPTSKSNVIPGFSIYYLLMVYDHMMYFGDRTLVKKHLPAIDQILAFFDRNLTENNLVGRVGGKIMRHRYWSFIDWSRKWDSGVPGACDQGCGSITMESLLYLYGLEKAAELADFIGRDGTAGEYRQRAEILKKAIIDNCIGELDGVKLIQDGPGVNEYSVHSQVFAILTGTVSEKEGKAMLEKTVGNEQCAQSSVAFMFYLFRALELCDWYEKSYELWDFWRTMLENNLTTVVENDTDERSDCHAWASLMCYEMPAVILGVQPAEPGFSKVRISPHMGQLSYAKGSVITPKGIVSVEWQNKDGKCDLICHLPEGMSAV